MPMSHNSSFSLADQLNLSMNGGTGRGGEGPPTGHRNLLTLGSLTDRFGTPNRLAGGTPASATAGLNGTGKADGSTASSYQQSPESGTEGLGARLSGLASQLREEGREREAGTQREVMRLTTEVSGLSMRLQHLEERMDQRMDSVIQAQAFSKAQCDLMQRSIELNKQACDSKLKAIEANADQLRKERDHWILLYNRAQAQANDQLRATQSASDVSQHFSPAQLLQIWASQQQLGATPPQYGHGQAQAQASQSQVAQALLQFQQNSLSAHHTPPPQPPTATHPIAPPPTAHALPPPAHQAPVAAVAPVVPKPLTHFPSPAANPSPAVTPAQPQFSSPAGTTPKPALLPTPTPPTTQTAPKPFSFGAPPAAAKSSDSVPSPIGRSPAAIHSRVSESEDHGAEHEYEPNVTFEPVCPLPDLIEVKTGEEDEEVLFSERAKLFRYIVDTKEFKERGLGDLKVLKHKESKKIRILMRREQVHKLCANHYLVPPMELKPMAKSDKAFTWLAKDFSEGEVTDETLAARFKTPDIAEKFKKVFEAAVKEMAQNPGSTPKKAEAPKPAKPAVGAGFGDAFKPKEGSWECSGCMTRVDPGKDSCPCCQTTKDGKPASGGSGVFGSGSTSSTTLPFAAPSNSSFTFGAAPAASQKKDAPAATPPKPAAGTGVGGFSFGASKTEVVSPSSTASAATAESTSPQQSGFNFGGFSFGKSPVVTKPAEEAKAAAKPKEEAKASPFGGFKGFSFGGPTSPQAAASSNSASPAASATPNSKVGATSPASTFGTATSPNSTFGAVAAQGNTSFAALASSGPGFGSAASTKAFAGKGTPLFGGGSAATPRTKKASESSDHGADDEHYEPNVTFEPVCPLPDLIEVKTGEEDEEVLFSERAKLFRYIVDTKEFKERGLGDLKVLKHKESKKIRILMRREQVHKLCANHYLVPPMELKPMAKSDKAFTWLAKDFSEGEVTDETLAARFKTPDIAEKFKKVFEAAVKEMAQNPGSTPKKAEAPKAQATGAGFGDAFKPKAGSWECSGCMTRVEAGVEACPCCQTTKDGKAAAGTGAGASLFGSSASAASTSLPFAAPTNSPFTFGAPAKPSPHKPDDDQDAREDAVLWGLAERAAEGGLGLRGLAGEEEETEDGEEEGTLVHSAKAMLRMEPLEAGVAAAGAVGTAKVFQDDDVDAYRLVFLNDDGRRLMSHIVVKTLRPSTVHASSPKAAAPMAGLAWEAMDFNSATPLRRKFTLLFTSAPGRDEFAKHLRDGVRLATDNDVRELDPASAADLQDLQTRSVCSPNTKSFNASASSAHGPTEE